MAENVSPQPDSQGWQSPSRHWWFYPLCICLGLLFRDRFAQLLENPEGSAAGFCLQLVTAALLFTASAFLFYLLLHRKGGWLTLADVWVGAYILATALGGAMVCVSMLCNYPGLYQATFAGLFGWFLLLPLALFLSFGTDSEPDSEPQSGCFLVFFYLLTPCLGILAIVLAGLESLRAIGVLAK